MTVTCGCCGGEAQARSYRIRLGIPIEGQPFGTAGVRLTVDADPTPTCLKCIFRALELVENGIIERLAGQS